MARWKPKRRRKSGWSRWRVPVLAVFLVGTWYVTRPLVQDEEWVAVTTRFGTCGERGRPFNCVSDGDTVTRGYGKAAKRIRLKGFDAPEIDGACSSERAQAALAQRELTDWLNRGAFEWDGGADPPRDRYGRELRSARRIGKNGEVELLSDYMIGKGLAEGDAFWESRDWCA